VQAELQQIPLEQNPEEHWLFEVHPSRPLKKAAFVLDFSVSRAA